MREDLRAVSAKTICYKLQSSRVITWNARTSIKRRYKYITTSINCRQLTRATKSCCRQSLTISAINCSGRASNIGGIVNLLTDDGPVYHALTVHLSRAKLIARSTVDMLWRNRVWSQVPEVSRGPTVIFGDKQIFL